MVRCSSSSAWRRMLGLGEVAHHVEVAQPLELVAELVASLGVSAGASACLRSDRVEREPAQRLVGLEIMQPID